MSEDDGVHETLGKISRAYYAEKARRAQQAMVDAISSDIWLPGIYSGVPVTQIPIRLKDWAKVDESDKIKPADLPTESKRGFACASPSEDSDAFKGWLR